MSLVDSDFGDAGGFEDTGFDQGLDSGLDAAMGADPTMDIPEIAPQYRKQEFNIYSIMLILSFLFLLIAMILFFQEAGRLA